MQTVDLWTHRLIPEMKRGSVSQSRFSSIYAHCFFVGSRHFLARKFMATVEVSHKAAGVHSSSKITNSYVTSFPGLPHIITFSKRSRHFRDQQRFLRVSIKVWQKAFPEFIDSQLQTAVWLAHLMLTVHSMSTRIKAIFIYGTK